MITSFGKFCSRLRMNNSVLLYDMAQRLNVSSSFLSGVENGKTKPPAEWAEVIALEYHLNDEQVGELKTSIAESRENIANTDNQNQFAFIPELNVKEFLNAGSRILITIHSSSSHLSMPSSKDCHQKKERK